MQIEIKMNLSGLFLKDFNRTMSLFHDELGKVFEQGLSYILRQVIRGTPNYTGGLQGSMFKSRVQGTGLNLSGFVSTRLAGQAVFIETGRPPHIPNLTNLSDWIRAKMGLEGSDLFAMTRFLSRKISRDGVKAWWMFRKAFETSPPEIQKMINRAEANVIRRWNQP